METAPKPDMRGVQFHDGMYSKRTGDLCERCGMISYCDKSSANNELDTDVVVSECNEFLPIIMFVNPKGTDDEFTTIRLGEAWMKRLVPGSIVALMDKCSVYGTAKVMSLTSGPKEQMIIESIWTNHMMLDFTAPVEERIEKMERIVRNAYGNLIWKNNLRATVLNLRRAT